MMSHYRMTNWRRQQQCVGGTHSSSDGPHLHLVVVVHTLSKHAGCSSPSHLPRHCHCPRKREMTGVGRDASGGYLQVVRVGGWVSEALHELSSSLRPLAASSPWPSLAVKAGVGWRRRTQTERVPPRHASCSLAACPCSAWQQHSDQMQWQWKWELGAKKENAQMGTHHAITSTPW